MNDPEPTTLNGARQYLHQSRWRPTLVNEAIPAQGSLRYRQWVTGLVTALETITYVRDGQMLPLAAAKFTPGTAIYNRAEIVSMVHIVIRRASAMYEFGSTNLIFKDPMNWPTQEDADLSFDMRLGAFAQLMRDFKDAADQVMQDNRIDEFLASPIRTGKTEFMMCDELWDCEMDERWRENTVDAIKRDYSYAFSIQFDRETPVQLVDLTSIFFIRTGRTLTTIINNWTQQQAANAQAASAGYA
ncbi:hypothetical protein BDV96DRAFT_642638 [Lophiotrema nucula]|uniref:Uncharacterized protein n=1 Tax=Lophiotrema nucula TaxID=690887 RepID=A0A6A5ZJ90_9PLEO|nr:hypothetical protein BDV96DRAFT_642638 [Lophiotrema nucula]